MAFSADERRLVSITMDGTVKAWDATTGQEHFTFKSTEDTHPGQNNFVRTSAFSADGCQLATATSTGPEGTAKVWNVTTGKATCTLNGHPEWIMRLAFSPDGQRLAGIVAVAGIANEVKVWDTTTGQEIFTLRGHTTNVGSLSFSPDGRRLASGDDNGTVKLWNVTTGREVLNLVGHTARILSLAFSPDGRRLASAGGPGDETVKVWDARPVDEETRDQEDASSLIRFLREEKQLKEPEVLAAIRQDGTINERVRQHALSWAESLP